MTFDWKEYFNLAKFLSGDSSITPDPEAKSRSAVSRAYFASYCYSRNYASKFLGFAPTGKVDDHEELRKCLRRHGHSKTARKLDDLRGLRNECDYEDSVPTLMPFVKISLDRTEKVFKELV